MSNNYTIQDFYFQHQLKIHHALTLKKPGTISRECFQRTLPNHSDAVSRTMGSIDTEQISRGYKCAFRILVKRKYWRNHH